ncbi:MAG: uracil-DNA glycosylase [Planctomycetaceae bacterium]|nr:uracil-DNA glycosylase [Planctomycetaceae bacterium]
MVVWPELVRQILEDWQRAGIRKLPIHLHPPQKTVPPRSAPAVPAKPPSRPTPTLSPGRLDLLREQALADHPEPPAEVPSSSAPTPIRTLPMIDGKNLSRKKREEHLEKLACVVSKCTRCEELAQTRTQTVFGVGNPEARIMFVGEAPGADEDKQGIPFVGRAGQLLDKIIEASQLKREDVYICNVLRCRPPGNRNPSPTEAANCREYLDGQIALVNPEYIICLGTIAAQNLLNTKTPIGRMRKQFHDLEGRKVMCTYHPSYLLRNPSAKKDVWEDMKMFMADLGIDLEGH